jgi:hypothetical protein
MTLNSYLLCIIGTVVIASILTTVVPEGKTTGVIKGMTKLVCLIVIIAPIPQFLQKQTFFEALQGDKTQNSYEKFSQSVIQTDDSFIKYYSEMRIRNTEAQLETELLQKYEVETRVTLAWEYEEYDVKITQITVKTQEIIAEVDKKVMWEYLTKNYCSEVLIE